MRYLIASLIIVLAGLVAPAIAEESENQSTPSSQPTSSALLKILPGDIVLGDPDAPVTIIEYASLSCPHCAEFHNKTLPDIKKKYIETGKVSLVFRPFPLNLPALHGSVLAYCAGEKRFYNFLKVLFDTQDSWAFHKNYLEMLSNIGKLGGIRPESFDRCLEDKQMEEHIMQTKTDAANVLKLHATPTFYVNGVHYEKSFRTEPLSQYLDTLLVETTEAVETEDNNAEVPAGTEAENMDNNTADTKEAE